MNPDLIYLATPYSHPCPVIRWVRFETVNRIAADMMLRGLFVYSPISHSHPIAQYGLPKDWEYWNKIDTFFLSICKKMIVVMADGWKESVGLKSEIQIAERIGIEIEYILP